MELNAKVIVVTGAGHGIGKALCRRFHREGAAHIVVSDIDFDAASAVAESVEGIAVRCDVSREEDIVHLVETASDACGPIDLFCSNAGFGCGDDGPFATSASNEAWQRSWDIHVMAHVYAARAVLPAMIERGSGYFLNTASAAGLLSQVGDAAYSATKHAAVGFAESLRIRHADQGIGVSVLCPQYVATAIIGEDDEREQGLPPGVISTAQLAQAVVDGLRDERFLILPHPQVQQSLMFKVSDYERWLKAMNGIKQTVVSDDGNIDFDKMHQIIGKA